jgi:ABC-type transport system involved in multi-copper enzyme maturation permease subunit
VKAVWLKNPLFRKELRIGLRERKFVWMQVIYLALACGVTLFSLRNLDSQTDYWSLRMEASQLVGVLILLQSAVLLLVTPAFSSAAISGEKERNSLDLLLVGGASPAQIVAGKLLHALLLSFLLLLGGLPMGVLSLVLGGGTIQGLGLIAFLLFWFTILLVQFGLMLSAREKRSGYATTQTYASLAVGFPLLLWFMATVPWLSSLVEALFQHPWKGYSWLAFNLLCLSMFFFLKTLNHLEPRARYPRQMGLLFLVWYVVDVACFSYYLGQHFQEESDWAQLWSWLSALNLVLLGCFLNRPEYRTRRDQHEFERYPGSRWWVWTVLFSLGMIALNVGPYLEGDQPAMLICLSGTSIVILWSTSAVVRAVAQAWPRAPFRLLYFFWLALIFGTPAVGLLVCLDRPWAPWWSLVHLSPMYSLVSVTAASPEVPFGYWKGERVLLGALCPASYLILTLLVCGAALLVDSRRRRARVNQG